jgi:hypothetical protein
MIRQWVDRFSSRQARSVCPDIMLKQKDAPQISVQPGSTGI